MSDGASAVRRALLAIGLLGLLAVAAPAAATVEGARAEALAERGARALRLGETADALELLEQAREQAPGNPEILALYARALLASGRSVEAAGLLEMLRRDGNAHADNGLLLGIAFFRIARYEEARELLTEAATRDPKSARAHLYLGATSIELGDYPAAEAQLDEADRLDPAIGPEVGYRRGTIALAEGRNDDARRLFEEVVRDAPVSVAGRAARVQLTSLEQGDRRWGAYATAGVAYDSNVGLAGQDIFQSGEASARLFTQVGANYMFFQDDRLSLQGGVDGFVSWNTNENTRIFNLSDTQGWLLGAFAVDPKVTLDLRYTFQYVWAGWEGFRLSNVVEPSIRFLPRPDLQTRFYWGADFRKYYFDIPVIDPANPSALDRDGNLQVPGFEQYWYPPDWTGWGAGFVRGGFFYRRERVDGTEYDSNGYNLNVMAGLPLPWRVETLVDFSYEWRNFLNGSVFRENPLIAISAGAKRRDRVIRTGIALRRPIYGRLLGELSYRYTDWNSKVAFYDYDRHLVNFLVTYKY